jgi:hypothetical protein
VDDKRKRRKAPVNKLKRSEPGIGMTPDGQGGWKLNVVGMVPEGQEIRPENVVWFDNPADELNLKPPKPQRNPRMSAVTNHDALLRDLEEIADLLLNNEGKAERR